MIVTIGFNKLMEVFHRLWSELKEDRLVAFYRPFICIKASEQFCSRAILLLINFT